MTDVAGRYEEIDGPNNAFIGCSPVTPKVQIIFFGIDDWFSDKFINDISFGSQISN
jgi:hypothetical protein